jgi:transketolase
MAASGRETERHRAYDQLCTLAMDAGQQANSGHPGTPMALAPLVHTLCRIHLGPHVAAA